MSGSTSLMSGSRSSVGDDAAARPESQQAAALPRLLAGLSSHEAMGLHDHLAVHGDIALQRGRGHVAEHLIEEIEHAGLRGHGGAGFPAARKLRAVGGARGRPIVVVNAAEGEPASQKDRTLLQMLPHLVIDGGLLCANALGAREVIICVCETDRSSQASVARAIDERRHARGAGRLAELTLASVPSGYVAGQESALVNHLNGGPGKPTFTPPMPFQQGVRRRPTLINNAETLAHIALIARHGARWFRELGTDTQPGSALITISGALAFPGVYEIEYGAPLDSLIAAGGGTTSSPRAALLGGYAGAWVGAEHLEELVLSEEHLAPYGATLGAGIVFLLSEAACPVAETARVARWLSDEGAGQCGPCINGLDALAATVEAVAAGSVGAAQGNRRVAQLARLVYGRGACAHPDGAVRFISSAARTFAAEFADHAEHGPCDACARPSELPLPDRGRRSTPAPRSQR
jgi:NADH:ubiquinone oxidoreductase subunit F (NADH-binding)